MSLSYWNPIGDFESFIRNSHIEEALAELKAKGIPLIDEKPRRGAGGAMIAFLHPKATSGILVELSQRDEH